MRLDDGRKMRYRQVQATRIGLTSPRETFSVFTYIGNICDN